MRPALLAGVALVVLTGCATLDRRDSKLTPGPVPGTWAFEAAAPLPYPADTPQGEAVRMDWLHTTLTEAGACPDGYTITSRQAVPIASLPGTQVHRVYYQLRCKEPA